MEHLRHFDVYISQTFFFWETFYLFLMFCAFLFKEISDNVPSFSAASSPIIIFVSHYLTSFLNLEDKLQKMMFTGYHKTKIFLFILQVFYNYKNRYLPQQNQGVPRLVSESYHQNLPLIFYLCDLKLWSKENSTLWIFNLKTLAQENA